MNGLINEVMSCAMNRAAEFQSMDESVRGNQYNIIDVR